MVLNNGHGRVTGDPPQARQQAGHQPRIGYDRVATPADINDDRHRQF
jgi:hypothetical protein